MVDLKNFEHQQIRNLLSLFYHVFAHHPQRDKVREVLNLLDLSMHRIISVLEEKPSAHMLDFHIQKLEIHLLRYVSMEASREHHQLPKFVNEFLNLFKTYYKFIDKNQSMLLDLCNVFRIVAEVYLHTDPTDEELKKEVWEGLEELVNDWLEGKVTPPASGESFSGSPYDSTLTAVLSKEIVAEIEENFPTVAEEISHEGEPRFLSKTLEIERENAVLIIKLHRPAQRNAMNHQMIQDLNLVFQTVADNAEVRVVILTGSDGVFCAGADLGEMLYVENAFQQKEWAKQLGIMLRRVSECPKPVVAVINGPVMGGGMGLMCVADIILSADDVTFSFPEVRLGIVPAVISPFVVARMGMTQARRYFLTGERIEPALAKTLGLVHEIAPASELPSLQQSIVNKLLSGSPNALSACKELLRYIAEHPLTENLYYAAGLLTDLRHTPDAKEGMTAFLEKRKPDWIPQP